jgi:hypothetical protein
MTKINNRPILFTLFLGFISSLGPLSIDMGLPGLSGVEAFYNLAAGQGALTFSVFVAGLAVSPLLGDVTAVALLVLMSALLGLVCWLWLMRQPQPAVE